MDYSSDGTRPATVCIARAGRSLVGGQDSEQRLRRSRTEADNPGGCFTVLARVLVQQYPADVMTDEVVEKVRTDILATIRRQDGNRAVLLLLDRATGNAMSVSL